MIVLHPMRRLHDMYGSLVVVVVSQTQIGGTGESDSQALHDGAHNGYVSSTLFIFGNREKLTLLCD